LTSQKKQFYIRRIAEIEEQVAKLIKVKVNEALVTKNAKLADKVAKLSKNSSNSSKPPSSDIVKPPNTHMRCLLFTVIYCCIILL